MGRMPRSKLVPAAAVLFALAALSACAAPNPITQPCPSFGILGDAEKLTVLKPGERDLTGVMYRATLSNTALKCKYKGVPSGPAIGGMPSGGPPGGGMPGGGGMPFAGPPAASSSAQDSPDENDDSGPPRFGANGGPPPGSRGRKLGKLGRIENTITFNLSVERGPALSGTEITIPYFVAVMRGGKYVLARQEFSQSFDLASGGSVVAQEKIPVTIPLARNTIGDSYVIVVGIVLTPDQLAYNRAQKAAR